MFNNILSLIIPVYNGALYLNNTFKDIEDFLVKKEYLKEIIFVNDGSSDNTEELINKFVQSQNNSKIKLISYSKNKGKGYAILNAVKEAQGDIIGFTDVELPYGLDAIERGIDAFCNGDIDIVSGNRFMLKKGKKQYSLYRKIGSKLFRTLIPGDIRSKYDTQCGLKFFKKNIAKEIFSKLKTYRWVFDVEIFLISTHSEYKICSLPVSVKPSCSKGRGGVLFFKHGFQVLADILRIRYYDLKRKK